MCCNSCCSGCGCGCGCSDSSWSCGSDSCGCGCNGGASTLPVFPDMGGRGYPIWLSVPAFISSRSTGGSVETSLGCGC